MSKSAFNMYLLAVWNTILLTNAHPLDLLLFNDLAGDDLNSATSASDLFGQPSSDMSFTTTGTDMTLPFNSLQDNRDDSLTLADASLPCQSKRSLPENSDKRSDQDVHARDIAPSLCSPKIDLPVDMFSTPEVWLRGNLHLPNLLPLNEATPDEVVEPLYLPDGLVNKKAQLEPWEDTPDETQNGPCSYPYPWYVCCDVEYGRRPSVYFAEEIVSDYMIGCHLSTFSNSGP